MLWPYQGLVLKGTLENGVIVLLHSPKAASVSRSPQGDVQEAIVDLHCHIVCAALSM